MVSLSTSSDIEKSEMYKPHEKYWYAVYVRSRHEKKVYHLFEEKGIESSLPLIKTTRKWSDRKKKVEIPLFKGYVFVRIDIAKEKLNILKTDGVVKFIGIRGKPSTIPDEQIHWLHRIVEEPFKVRSEKEIPIGQKVHVMLGPFKGMEGVVMTARNRSRILICIESIMQTVSIEINPNYLEKINN